VGAQGGPHARHLVGRHRHAGAGPAADDAAVGLTGHHRLADAAADIGPRVVLEAHHDLVAALLEGAHDLVGDGRALVGAEGDAHGNEATSRPRRPRTLRVWAAWSPSSPTRTGTASGTRRSSRSACG